MWQLWVVVKSRVCVKKRKCFLQRKEAKWWNMFSHLCGHPTLNKARENCGRCAWESCSAIIISYPFKEDRFVATSYRFCILLCHSSWLNGNPHQAFTNLVWFWRGAFERRLNGFAFLFCQGHRSLVTYSEQSKLFLCW